jgi:hypothetical protein
VPVIRATQNYRDASPAFVFERWTRGLRVSAWVPQCLESEWLPSAGMHDPEFDARFKASLAKMDSVISLPYPGEQSVFARTIEAVRRLSV